MQTYILKCFKFYIFRLSHINKILGFAIHSIENSLSIEAMNSFIQEKRTSFNHDFSVSTEA